MYNFFLELISLTQHLFLNVITVVTWSVSTPCTCTNVKAQWDRSNVQLI